MQNSFPLAADPFRAFSSLPPEEMLEKANRSRHDGYGPYTFPIAPASAAEEKLLSQIAIAKQSIIQFRGSETFVQKCEKAVAELLQKPIGRSLLLTICRIKSICIIEQGKTPHAGPRGDEIAETCLHIFLPLKKLYYSAETADRRRLLHILPFPVLMAHELLHCMQKASFYTRAKTEEIANRTIPLLFETPSTDPYFPLLIERITILGVDGILPSENAFHFAFGTPKVFRYYVSPFPPVRSNISCPLILDANGKSRVENAAFYGLSEEVRLLLQQEGNSLEAAIKGAGEGGERALVEQLLFQKRMHNVMENIATFFQSLLIFGPPGVSSTS